MKNPLYVAASTLLTTTVLLLGIFPPPCVSIGEAIICGLLSGIFILVGSILDQLPPKE